MGTVTISAVDYSVYGTHTGADSLEEYALGDLAREPIYNSSENTASSGKRQKQALVSATRVISGLDFADETHADPTTAGLPQPIIDAAYELALAGLADSSIFTTTTTEDKIKRVDAKGVNVEWFGPRDGGRLPGRVAELLAPYLAGTSSSGVGAGSYAAGVDGESAFDACDEFGINGGG